MTQETDDISLYEEIMDAPLKTMKGASEFFHDQAYTTRP